MAPLGISGLFPSLAVVAAGGGGGGGAGFICSGRLCFSFKSI